MTSFDADLAVVGLGPAGCACAVQAARAGLTVLGLDDRMAGGLVGAANRIENVPLFPEGIDGAVLARRLVRSLRRPGVRTQSGTVTGLATAEGDAPGFVLRVEGAGAPLLRVRAVCLATGTEPAPLPAWLAAAGPAVHRDVRTLPAPLAGKLVAVVGGGDAAYDTALGLVRRGARVALLVRGRKARAAAPLVRQVAGQPAIEVRLGWEAGEPGTRRPDGWRLVDDAGAAHDVEAIVACVGRVPRRGLLDGLPIRDDAPPEAPLPGLFLAGDLRRERVRFIAPAMADGLHAAEAAAWFLEEVRAR